MVINHQFYMRLALEEAWHYQGLTYPNPAVGCTVLGPNGDILSVEAHKKAGGPHAEVAALKAAYLKLSPNPDLTALLRQTEDSRSIHAFLKSHHQELFKGCKLYVTLEPCNHEGRTPPCSELIAALGIEEVYIGAMDPNETAAGGCTYLQNRGLKVTSGIMEGACRDLLIPFTAWQKKRFVVFKHAQTANGVIDGGYITGERGLDFVHAMRNVCDLLVIGGETVRNDRPTLDARRVGGKAPDVLIFSRQQAFDDTIPLFRIPGRKVMISDSLEAMEGYKNILIEGGNRMFDAVAEHINMHLRIIAPCIKTGKHFDTNASEKIVWRTGQGDDTLEWCLLEKARQL